MGHRFVIISVQTKSRMAAPGAVFLSSPSNTVGEWLSLVEHLVRDQGVGGSNPLSPTNFSFFNHRVSHLSQKNAKGGALVYSRAVAKINRTDPILSQKR